MKIIKLCIPVLILLLSCDSEEYKKVKLLPQEESSLNEMISALDSDKLSEKEYIKISSNIDNIYLETVANLPIDESSLIIISETIVKAGLSQSGKDRLNTLSDEITESIRDKKLRIINRIKNDAEQRLKYSDLKVVNEIIYESLENNEIDEEDLKELLLFTENKYKDIQEEDKKLRGWSEGYYIDSFGDRTGETFTRKKINGLFSNSATNNSELGVDILFDLDSIDFRLYEYGFDRGVEKEFLDSILLLMKNEKNEELEIFIYRKAGSGKISVYFSKKLRSKDFYTILNFFEKSEEVKVRISAGESYSFTVDTKYFNMVQ